MSRSELKLNEYDLKKHFEAKKTNREFFIRAAKYVYYSTPRLYPRAASKNLLSSSSLRASKEGPSRLVLCPTGVFQNLRNLFPHDIHDIVG